MTTKKSIAVADSLRGAKSKSRTRFSSEVDAREHAEHRLREALGREAALVEALARDEAVIRHLSEMNRRLAAWHEAAIGRVAGLTRRQHEIMVMIVAGTPNKNIAADLGISQRTVENHRAGIMKRTGSKCLASLARLALAAEWVGGPAQFETGASALPGRSADNSGEQECRSD